MIGPGPENAQAGSWGKRWREKKTRREWKKGGRGGGREGGRKQVRRVETGNWKGPGGYGVGKEDSLRLLILVCFGQYSFPYLTPFFYPLGFFRET